MLEATLNDELRSKWQLSKRDLKAYLESMNERVKKLTDEAQKLTPEEQEELPASLDSMVNGDEYAIDPELLAECERRWERYECGETRLYTWDEVKAQLLKL